MNVKELREKIKDLSDDMEIVMGLEHSSESIEGYGLVGFKVRKVKSKLVRPVDIHHVLVQSRPFKDGGAQLMLIFE